MKIDVQLTPTEDFMMLCSIYEIKPEMVLQTFVDQVSFPRYYSHDREHDKWAILFFLQYLDDEDDEKEINEELQDYYLNRFSKVVAHHLDRYPNDLLKAEVAGREIMRQWQKALLTERAKYITDRL